MTINLDFSKLEAPDILDLAIFAEQEAKEHYEQIEGWMRSAGNTEAADFFHRMAELELSHKQTIEARRQAKYPDAPRHYTETLAWDVEIPDYSTLNVSNMTLAKAFDTAIGAEDKAAEYYNEAIHYVDDDEIIALFRELAQAEVGHRNMLEAERRRLGV